ncbi:MAG: hypothetical protein ABSH31_16850 [Bryobacteraceae bacterium]|jgi:hypothetical protein
MNEATSELLADANDIVREQLALAWRAHVERVRDVLEAQWPERMERALEETVAGLAARLEADYQDALEARLSEAVHSGRAARRELIQKLNQTARRLRHFENEGRWSHTLVDATRGFCGRAALFSIHDRKLHFEAARNIDQSPPTDDVALDSAPAFASAIETRDTLVAIRTSSELSEPLAAYLFQGQGPAEETRCCLFPIVTRQGVAGVLYADSEEVDIDALELLVATAGAVPESSPAAGAGELVSITPASQKPEILSWFSLSHEDRELHLRAQRFARVQVAEIRLYQSEKVKNGRTAHDLYTSLKEEILSAREAFRREFLNASDSMVDYLHLELVRTLANDDAELLGHDYPGPMV